MSFRLEEGILVGSPLKKGRKAETLKDERREEADEG